MKRLASLLLALFMLFSLAACSKGEGSQDPDPSDTPSSSSGSKDDPSDSPDSKETPSAPSGKGDAEPGTEGYIFPDEDGIAMGYAGDTLRTAFFDMTINDPYTCDEFDGLTPGEGRKFLVAELTLYNYTNYSQPIYDTDFEVLWDLDDDTAWAMPEYDERMGADGKIEYVVRSEKQLPTELDLGIHKSVTAVLLFQVPVDTRDFFIDFYEVYDDGTEEGTYGDAFYVRFSA